MFIDQYNILFHYRKETVYKMAAKMTLTTSVLGYSLVLLVIFAEFVAAQYPAMPFARRGGKKKRPWDDGHDKENDLLVTKKAFFDIAIDDEPVGRIEIGLFGDTCPVTVQNFAALTRGNFRNDVSEIFYFRFLKKKKNKRTHKWIYFEKRKV